MNAEKKNISVWLSAGGTGGHISPAIAIAESFLQAQVRITFISLKQNASYPDIDALKNEAQVEAHFYSAPRFPVNFKTALLFLPQFIMAFFSLCRLYTKQRAHPPEAFVSFGGYPVFPFLIFAVIFRIPFYMCEQNAMPGKVTRMFARYAQKIFLSLPSSIEFANGILSGNPLRKKIRQQFASKTRKKKILPSKNILIVGGSQGARDLNLLYLQMIADAFFKDYNIEISAGKNMLAELKEFAHAHKRKDKVQDFIFDMHRALREADIVISRAGSGLLFEICAAQKGAVLLPFAFAADDHQAANARQLQKLNLAKIIDLRPFAPNEALSQLKKILDDKKFWQSVSSRYRKETPLLLNAHMSIVEYIITDIMQAE